MPGSDPAALNNQGFGQQQSFGQQPLVQPSFGFGGGPTTGGASIFGGGARPLGFTSPSFPSPLAANPFLPQFSNPATAGPAAQQPSAPQAAVAGTNPFNLPPPHVQAAPAQPSFRPPSGFGAPNASAGAGAAGLPFPATLFGAAGAQQGAHPAAAPDGRTASPRALHSRPNRNEPSNLAIDSPGNQGGDSARSPPLWTRRFRHRAHGGAAPLDPHAAPRPLD